MNNEQNKQIEQIEQIKQDDSINDAIKDGCNGRFYPGMYYNETQIRQESNFHRARHGDDYIVVRMLDQYAAVLARLSMLESFLEGKEGETYDKMRVRISFVRDGIVPGPVPVD